MAIPYTATYDEIHPFSDVSRIIHLTLGVVTSFVIPGDSTKKFTIKFEYISESNVFVGYGVSPSIPAANTVNSQQYVEFRPGDSGDQRYVIGGKTLYFLTPDAVAYVGVSIREIPA